MLLFRHSVMSNFLQLHGLQHTKLPCPSQSPKFDKTHVHGVSDAMQPSLSPSPLPSIIPRTRVFSNEPTLCIRWPKHWSFSFSISPSSEYSGSISFRIDWFDLLVVQGTLKSSPIPHFKGISSSALSLFYCPALTSIHYYWKNHRFD